MVRSELRNKFLRSRYSKDRESTKKQSFLRYSVGSEEKGYFETLVIKSVTDNKVLWKIVAPLFSIVYKKTDEWYIE